MTGRRYRAIFESRNHMRTLVAVAETGSMTEAARILDTTQPAVSRVIASFEESVGAELFKRRGPGPRSLRLTTIGIIVAHQARCCFARYMTTDFPDCLTRPVPGFPRLFGLCRSAAPALTVSEVGAVALSD